MFFGSTKATKLQPPSTDRVRVYFCVCVCVCLTRLTPASHGARRRHRPAPEVPRSRKCPSGTSRTLPRCAGAAANAVPRGPPAAAAVPSSPCTPAALPWPAGLRRPSWTRIRDFQPSLERTTRAYLVQRRCSGRDIPEHMAHDCILTVPSPVGKTPQIIWTICSCTRSPAE